MFVQAAFAGPVPRAAFASAAGCKAKRWFGDNTGEVQG
jgi:hypothetical protein